MNFIKPYQYCSISLILLILLSFQAQAGIGFCVNLKQINQQYFNESMGMIWHPTQEAWLVWEKTGNLHLLNPNNGSSRQIASLKKHIDTRGDGGLLGLALHPKYPQKPYLFITRTIFDKDTRILVLERYRFDDLSLQQSSKKVLLKTVLTGVENTAGFIVFDHLGRLFMSIGDGRNEGSNIASEAKNPESLMGSLLRLDIDTDDNNALAAPNNPFTQLPHRTLKTYAYGFKNPNRFSIDARTGDIWLSDVGIQTRGEINYIQAKRFYGWDCRDGSSETALAQTIDCANIAMEEKPVFEYQTHQGLQAIGGFVYRGKKNKHWRGRYFFADFGSGTIWNAVTQKNYNFLLVNKSFEGEQINPVAFAEDDNKELYLVEYQGRIFQMLARQCRVPQRSLIR